MFLCLYVLMFVYDMFHILLSCDSLRDLWNAYMYVCISFQFIPLYAVPEVQFNIILPRTPESPKWSLSLRFPQPKPCIHICASSFVLHALLILVDSITHAILGEEHGSLSANYGVSYDVAATHNCNCNLFTLHVSCTGKNTTD